MRSLAWAVKVNSDDDIKKKRREANIKLFAHELKNLRRTAINAMDSLDDAQRRCDEINLDVARAVPELRNVVTRIGEILKEIGE